MAAVEAATNITRPITVASRATWSRTSSPPSPQHLRKKSPFDLRSLLLRDGCGMHYTALFDLWKACGGENAEGAVRINCTSHVAITRDYHVPAPGRSETDEVVRRIRAHADADFGHVRTYVKMLPPNTTTELQPAEQGLIAYLKAKWRRNLDERSMHAKSAVDAEECLWSK